MKMLKRSSDHYRPFIPTLLFGLLFMYCASGSASEWSIDQLMQHMAQTRSGHARFVEIKYLAMLERPLESSGELFYTAPDYLEKRTIAPKPESMTLDGGTLVIARGAKKRVVQLREFPELRAFIECIRATLAGDRQALEANFKLSLSGTGEHWILDLQPIEERMQAVVKNIRIAGADNEVSSIEISQPDGDSSLMLIEASAAP